jgi:hypothetical protein
MTFRLSIDVLPDQYTAPVYGPAKARRFPFASARGSVASPWPSAWDYPSAAWPSGSVKPALTGLTLAPPDQGELTSDELSEQARLRKATRELRREKDFFRPAAAHFAKEQLPLRGFG